MLNLLLHLLVVSIYSTGYAKPGDEYCLGCSLKGTSISASYTYSKEIIIDSVTEASSEIQTLIGDLKGFDICGDATFCLDLSVDVELICSQIEGGTLYPESDINPNIVINYCKTNQQSEPIPSISSISSITVKNIQDGFTTEISVTCTETGIDDVPFPTISMQSPILRDVNNNIGSANTGTVSIQGSSETVVMLSYDPTTSS